MEWCYKGWVPTVTGRLSFSVIGNTSHPHRAIRSNRADSLNRYLIVFQKRVLTDSTLPFSEYFLRLFRQREANLKFICVAKSRDNSTDKDACLDGVIYFIPRGKIWKNQIHPILKRSQHKLDQYDAYSDSALEEYFEEDYQKLCSSLARIFKNSNEMVGCNFKLKRSGGVVLDPLPIESVSDNVYSQMFIFLKDITHHHQHHNPKTDTITDTVKCKEADDVYWRCETLHCLLKKIITFKRHDSIKTFHNSKGTLAYALAFEHICDLELTDPAALNPRFDSDSLLKSLDARESIEALKISEKRSNSAFVRTILFTALSILLSISALASLAKHKLNFSEDNYVIKLARIVIEEPMTIILYSTIFVAILLVYFKYWQVLDWKLSSQYVRSILPHRKNLAFAATSALAVVLIYWGSQIILP